MAFSKTNFVDSQTVIDAATLNAIQDELIRVGGLLGKDIQSATINDSGHLILTLTDGTTLDAGVAKGAQGEKGATGPAGPAGPQGPAGAPGKGGAPGIVISSTQPTDEAHPVWLDPNGDADGEDFSLGISSATVGQIAKISAVDDNGKPTAWGTIDGYTGQVTVDNLTNPDHPTDLVQYAAFQAAVPMVQQMGIFGATVGQIIKVKAVNSDGCPTAWEPADMPSGGGDGEWVFAGSVTAESADTVLKVSNIHAKHILVSLYASCDNGSNSTYSIRLNDTINYIRSSALPRNGEKHLRAVEFELLTGGDENYIYCRVISDENNHTSKSNDLVSNLYSTAVQGTMWYKVNISEFNSVAFLSGNGTTSAGNIMNVWYR